MKYKVYLTFRYSDIVHVEADNEEDAIKKAMDECQEEYECWLDAGVTKDND